MIEGYGIVIVFGVCMGLLVWWIDRKNSAPKP